MRLQNINKTETLDFYSVNLSTEIEIPLANSTISAGFPSPADDYIDLSIDLNKQLINNPSSTFFARVKGNSMQGENINDGDLLVIDKAAKPKSGKVAVCFLDGEFTVKKIKLEKDIIWLVPANPQYTPIKVTKDNQFVIWGIVTYVIHKV
jgi:SOS-response transcriptional repressors (RecA-mediated autopeptidases)